MFASWTQHKGKVVLTAAAKHARESACKLVACRSSPAGIKVQQTWLHQPIAILLVCLGKYAANALLYSKLARDIWLEVTSKKVFCSLHTLQSSGVDAYNIWAVELELPACSS